jgi:hypothetical protein
MQDEEGMIVEPVEENQAVDVSEQVSDVKTEDETVVEDQPAVEVVAIDV